MGTRQRFNTIFFLPNFAVFRLILSVVGLLFLYNGPAVAIELDRLVILSRSVDKNGFHRGFFNGTFGEGSSSTESVEFDLTILCFRVENIPICGDQEKAFLSITPGTYSVRFYEDAARTVLSDVVTLQVEQLGNNNSRRDLHFTAYSDPNLILPVEATVSSIVENGGFQDISSLLFPTVPPIQSFFLVFFQSDCPTGEPSRPLAAAPLFDTCGGGGLPPFRIPEPSSFILLLTFVLGVAGVAAFRPR